MTVIRRSIFTAENVRWLIAETLVVVLGILIALGLDDYRTGIAERRLAIEYVGRIQENLEQDLRYIKAVWIPGIKIKREALEAVGPVIRGQAPVPADRVTFLKQVSLAGAMGVSTGTWYTDATFEDLRATGNLRLIQDAQLRADITEYYEMVERQTLRVASRLTDYASHVLSVVPSELREKLDAESLEQFGIDFALDHLLTDDFRMLLNREYNLLLFMETMRFEEEARALHEELESYRIALQGE